MRGARTVDFRVVLDRLHQRDRIGAESGVPPAASIRSVSWLLEPVAASDATFFAVWPSSSRAALKALSGNEFRKIAYRVAGLVGHS